MNGYVKKRGKSYSVIIDLGINPLTGKRKQKWISGFETKKQAQEKLPELLVQYQSAPQLQIEDIFLRKYMEDWLNAYAKYNVSPTTFLFYEDIIKRILSPCLGNIKVSKLTPLQIQTFLSDMLKNGDISTTTVKHYYDVLNILLNQAVKWQVITSNPCIHVQPPKNRNKQIKVLTAEQTEVLLGFIKTSEFDVMYMPILLAITCGMRRGEILGLKWEDVDLDSGVLHIRNNLQLIKNEFILLPTKTDLSQRSITLLPSTIGILKQYENEQKLFKLTLKEQYRDQSFVCSWPDGKPIRPDYVTKTFKRDCK